MMNKFLLLPLLALGLCSPARAATSNGNDFALAYTEAKTPEAKSLILKDAQGRPHYFRYLKINELQEVNEAGQPGIQIAASEPSSDLNVHFTVTLPVSLTLLRANPVSKVGDGLAVTGKVRSIDDEKHIIFLDAPIVRLKDRLIPKAGKELISEVDPTATVYSFTEGPRPINLQARDRDLLEFRDKILAESGKKGWFEFLEKEIAKRKQQRAKEGQP